MWHQPASDAPITSYRLVWGQQRAQAAGPGMDAETALTKVLGEGIHTYNIGNLQESKTYIAQLQALSAAGAGHVSAITFTTPRLENQKPIEPPYRFSPGAL